MLLSNRDILEEARFDNIIIDPFLPELMQPASYDVRLDCRFQILVPQLPGDPTMELDPAIDPSPQFTEIEVPKGAQFVLEPGAFVLASTYEAIALGANIAARCEGKSSLGRLGLVVHSTAGFIDPGFEGTVTLELSNSTDRPIILYPGMKIAQLCFFRLPSPSTILYGSRAAKSHYQNQSGPTVSRGYDKFKVYDIYPVDTQDQS